MADDATTQPTATSRRKNFKVGELFEVEPGSTLTRPDGSAVVVGRGGHVLDVPGTYTIDGREITAADAK